MYILIKIVSVLCLIFVGMLIGIYSYVITLNNYISILQAKNKLNLNHNSPEFQIGFLSGLNDLVILLNNKKVKGKE